MTTAAPPRTHTQNELIREHLLTGRELTQRDAYFLFGCFRLPSRIHELKKQGMEIEKRMVKTPGGATVASYYLASFQHALEV